MDHAFLTICFVQRNLPISLVCFNWLVPSARSCSFDSLVESGRRSGDGGIQIHYVDEGAPGVSMKHDYD